MTFFFMARRFVLPNLMFLMQAWGLHAPVSLWDEVDAALVEFVLALCPVDLAHRLDADWTLRRELALPQRGGGLGIPLASAQAPVRATARWGFDDEVATCASRIAAGFPPPPPGATASIFQLFVCTPMGTSPLSAKSRRCSRPERRFRRISSASSSPDGHASLVPDGPQSGSTLRPALRLRRGMDKPPSQLVSLMPAGRPHPCSPVRAAAAGNLCGRPGERRHSPAPVSAATPPEPHNAA